MQGLNLARHTILDVAAASQGFNPPHRPSLSALLVTFRVPRSTRRLHRARPRPLRPAPAGRPRRPGSSHAPAELKQRGATLRQAFGARNRAVCACSTIQPGRLINARRTSSISSHAPTLQGSSFGPHCRRVNRNRHMRLSRRSTLDLPPRWRAVDALRLNGPLKRKRSTVAAGTKLL